MLHNYACWDRNRKMYYTTMHAGNRTGRCVTQICMLGIKQEDVLYNNACWESNRKMCYTIIYPGIQMGRCATQQCMLGYKQEVCYTTMHSGIQTCSYVPSLNLAMSNQNSLVVYRPLSTIKYLHPTTLTIPNSMAS